ncbi:hypothetical protein [Methylobacterium oryzisoli]|uniref:hypothetical protein n=1 Tax=Methylobacterium oryzisoli TaxID=3385502 RepID=UPI00397E1355
MTLDARPETHQAEEPAPIAPAVEPKRRVGRPSEGVRGFGTRLSPGTIDDIKALAEGLRLRSEGKAIEKAVQFYKEHLLREVRAKLGDLGDEADLLREAHKVD